jgi:excisionase family DNA binding protein
VANGEIPSVKIGEAAHRLGVSAQTVRRMIKRNVLEGWRTRSPDEFREDRHGRTMQGHWRVSTASLEAAEASRKNLEKSSTTEGNA